MLAEVILGHGVHGEQERVAVSRLHAAQQADDFAIRQRRTMPDELDLESLGLTARTLDQDLADRFDLGSRLPSGAIVTDVQRGGKADRVGIEAGHIITHVNGVGIEDTSDLRVMLFQMYGLEADELNLRLHTERGTRNVTLSLLEE